MSAEWFNLVLHGTDAASAGTVGEVLAGVDGLFRAVAKEMTGDEVGLAVAGFHWMCDGCGTEVPALPDGWVKRGADDLCEACAGVEPAAEEAGKPQRGGGGSDAP